MVLSDFAIWHLVSRLFSFSPTALVIALIWVGFSFFVTLCPIRHSRHWWRLIPSQCSVRLCRWSMHLFPMLVCHFSALAGESFGLCLFLGVLMHFKGILNSFLTLCTSVCMVNASTWSSESFTTSQHHSSALAGKFNGPGLFHSVLTFPHMFIAVFNLFSMLCVSVCVLSMSTWVPDSVHLVYVTSHASSTQVCASSFCLCGFPSMSPSATCPSLPFGIKAGPVGNASSPGGQPCCLCPWHVLDSLLGPLPFAMYATCLVHSCHGSLPGGTTSPGPF